MANVKAAANFAGFEDSGKGRLQVLQLEDSEADAELAVQCLHRDGYQVCAERVESEADFRKALDDRKWDVILADYRLPQFNAAAALSVVRTRELDIPFIVISGAIGEEIAVEMMKSGADDFLIKGKLARLGPAVTREIRQAKNRRECRRAEEELRVAHWELGAIYANAPVLLLVADERYRVEKVNDLAAGSAGREARTLIGSTVCEVIGCARYERCEPGGTRPACHENCALTSSVLTTLRTGRPTKPEEVWLPSFSTGERAMMCYLLSAAPLPRALGAKALLCLQDISPLKMAEKCRQETIAKLETALNERGVLLQEIHHRVKNVLQLVCSLLSLQARTVDDRAVALKLLDSEQRIHSMWMIHEQLYRQEDMAAVDLATCARSLATHLPAAYERGSAIKVKLELAPVKLTLEQSIPCGLILNELIVNSLKHAYPNGEGEIVVRLAEDKEECVLTVHDYGVGLPAAFCPENASSLGLSIVYGLSRQLGGSLDVSGPPGARFEVRFRRSEGLVESAERAKVYAAVGAR